MVTDDTATDDPNRQPRRRLVAPFRTQVTDDEKLAARPGILLLVESTRVDKWVWAIRLYKTRSDATDACRGGHVKINGQTAKPAAVVRVGDRVVVRARGLERDVEVAQVIDKRVGASVAAACFVDHTPPPVDLPRSTVAERERGAGRPTKRDRRRLDRLRDRS